MFIKLQEEGGVRMSNENQTPVFAPDAIAGQLLSALDAKQQVELPSKSCPDFTLERAYAVGAIICEMRRRRGEQPIGRKIGFTNKNIWPRYNVFRPIWGHMYDSTVHDLSAIGDEFDISHLSEPRIEPEIVLGLARSPDPEMDETALLSCIEWVAHGFEIVQSVYPEWQFTAADSIAAFALHGAYLMGPRHKIAGRSTIDWGERLSSFEITLKRGLDVIDHGTGANVLGGPVSALRHLVGVLSNDPAANPISAGEIVSTGTLTGAFPVATGETWSTSIKNLPVGGIKVRFV